MVENMFFLESEHVGIGNAPSKKVVCLFMLDARFLKTILLGYDFFVAAIIRYVAGYITCKISHNSKDSV